MSKSLPTQNDSEAWVAELFSDDWGTYWVLADRRTADDAIAIAAKYDGPFDNEPSARIVTANVEMRDGEPFVTEHPDGGLRFWRVDAS